MHNVSVGEFASDKLLLGRPIHIKRSQEGFPFGGDGFEHLEVEIVNLLEKADIFHLSFGIDMQENGEMVLSIFPTSRSQLVRVVVSLLVPQGVLAIGNLGISDVPFHFRESHRHGALALQAEPEDLPKVTIVHNSPNERLGASFHKEFNPVGHVKTGLTVTGNVHRSIPANGKDDAYEFGPGGRAGCVINGSPSFESFLHLSTRRVITFNVIGGLANLVSGWGKNAKTPQGPFGHGGVGYPSITVSVWLAGGLEQTLSRHVKKDGLETATHFIDE